jgi:hypothetical protein
LQLEQALTRLQWYEGRLRDLETAREVNSPAAPEPMLHPKATRQGTAAVDSIDSFAEIDGACGRHAAPQQHMPCDTRGAESTEAGKRACQSPSVEQLHDLLGTEPDPGASPPYAREALQEIPTDGQSTVAAVGECSLRRSSSTISFGDGENQPQNSAAPLRRSTYGGSHAVMPLGESTVPRLGSAALTVASLAPALSLAALAAPRRSCSREPHSPASMPLSLAQRAVSAHAALGRAAPTTFGTEPASGSASDRDDRARTPAPPPAPPTVSTLSASPARICTVSVGCGCDLAPTVRDAAHGTAHEAPVHGESVPREPLAAVTNRMSPGWRSVALAPFAGAAVQRPPLPACSKPDECPATAPARLDTQTLADASALSHSALQREKGDAAEAQGWLGRGASVSGSDGEALVARSVQDLTARLQEEHMRNEALLFALKKQRAAAPEGAAVGPAAVHAPARHAQATADAAVQMVHSQVFALDAIIQCKIAEDECAVCRARGDDTLSQPRSRSPSQPGTRSNGTHAQLQSMVHELRGLHDELVGSVRTTAALRGGDNGGCAGLAAPLTLPPSVLETPTLARSRPAGALAAVHVLTMLTVGMLTVRPALTLQPLCERWLRVHSVLPAPWARRLLAAPALPAPCLLTVRSVCRCCCAHCARLNRQLVQPRAVVNAAACGRRDGHPAARGERLGDACGRLGPFRLFRCRHHPRNPAAALPHSGIARAGMVILHCGACSRSNHGHTCACSVPLRVEVAAGGRWHGWCGSDLAVLQHNGESAVLQRNGQLRCCSQATCHLAPCSR